MPDLTRGHTFTSGEEVDHTKLNNLVGNAAINDSAITEVKVAASAIINSKVSASAAIALSKLAYGSSGQVIVGASGDGVPTYRTVTGDVTISDAGVTAIGADKVLTASVLDANITTAKIADNAVTADKLADTDVTAAAYTNASITVDDQGRLTAASNGAGDLSAITTITSAGDWTKPTGAKVIQVTVLGAGGGGGDETGASGTGVGGDGGAVSDWIDVTSVTTVAVSIGRGGTGGTGGTNDGTDGTSSSFGSYLTGTGGIGGLQGAVAKAANGTVTGSQPTAMSLDSMIVNSTYCKGGGKGVNGGAGAVIVRVIG